MAVPYTFGSATTSIPLSQLDSNFATTITLGNTAVQLGNTITTLTGVTNLASSGSLTLGTSGNTTAVTIDTSQNVGIGTASPSFTGGSNGVMISGLKPALRLSSTTTGAGSWEIYADSASAGGLGFYERQNNQTLMYIDEGGNVGIGTTSPTSQNGKVLQIDGGAGAADIRLTNTATGTAKDNGTLLGIQGSDTYLYNFENAFMAFGTNATERMRILSGGSVCVNTSAAQIDGTSRLVVATTTASGIAAEFQNNTSGTCTLAISNTGAATSTLVNWYANSSYRASVSWNGTLVVYGTSSDARLKENITDAGSGLAKLADVKIRSFDWKESGTHTDFGVVAQELQTVAPEAVIVGKDNEDGSIKESWSVDSSILVPAMIKAIQELKAINDSLTARIVALESK
jgi:hypothetical protein